MSDKRHSNSFREAVLALKKVIQEAYKLAPGVVLVAGIFFTLLMIFIAFLLPSLIMIIVILVFLVVSATIFHKTNNYGESALALVVGILTAFTVNWTSSYFIAFVITWFIFSGSVFLLSSIKLASSQEYIYKHAAQVISPEHVHDIEQQLRRVPEGRKIKFLGPIKQAEVIRFFAFYKLPIPEMSYALRMVDILTINTNVACETIARFVADIYKMSPEAFENSHKCNRLLDYIYETIRTSSVQPDEFLAAFQNSRRIALSQTFPLHLYLQRLKEALDKGVSPEEICKYLLSTTSTKRSIHSAHTVASNSSNATGNDYLEELLKKEPGF